MKKKAHIPEEIIPPDFNCLNAKVVIPDWVKWIATDDDGQVWGYNYEPEPRPEADCWATPTIHDGDSQLLYQGLVPKNWKLELYTWR